MARVVRLSGRVKVNREPAPSSDSTRMVPPWSSTSWRVMARPRPVPPCSRVAEPSPWEKDSKICVELLGRNADSGVGHRDLQPCSSGLREHLDSSAGRELEGIANQVEQDLLDPILVGLGQRDVGRDPVEDAQRSLADERPRNGQHEIGEGMQIGRAAVQLDLLMAQLREVEEIVDQIGEPPAARDDHSEVAPLLVAQRSGRPVEHRLADADDAVQRRAQLVRGVGQELVLQRVGPQQGLLGLLASGDVADDAGEASSSIAADLA